MDRPIIRPNNSAVDKLKFLLISAEQPWESIPKRMQDDMLVDLSSMSPEEVVNQWISRWEGTEDAYMADDVSDLPAERREHLSKIDSGVLKGVIEMLSRRRAGWKQPKRRQKQDGAGETIGRNPF